MNKKNVAKIYSGEGDLAKRWFVYFSENGKRKKVYGDINTFNCYEKRMSAAKQLLEEIETGRKKPSIIGMIEKALFLRNVCEKTVSGHKSKMNRFREFCELRELDSFTSDNAKDFCVWLKQEGLHDTTINHYIGTFRGCFKELIDESKYIGANPFGKIKDYKTDYTPARYYTNAQMHELMGEIKLEYQLYMFVSFIYYCFIRPKELRYLKVSDVILDEKRIRVPATASKNRKTQYVSIPAHFYQCVETFIIHRSQKEWLFESQTCKGKQVGHNTMYNKHRAILDKLEYDNSQYCLYSWKHTGAVACVKAGISIKFLQLQLRHSSLDMVNKYLRQLGVDDMSELQDKFPQLR